MKKGTQHRGTVQPASHDTQSILSIHSIYLLIYLYIQAEKERLLYDMQRPGRPLDEDGEHNAIRRGPRAGPSHDASEATSLPSSLPPSLPPGPPFSTSGGSSTPVALCLPGTNWEAVARRWHALNPGWGCSAVAQTALAVSATAKASSTQGEEQLAPEALAQASQSCSSTSSERELYPGAGPCVELHQQGTTTQTGCWSPAEAAPEGAQRIEEGPAAASPCSSISFPHLPGFGTNPSELHLIFAKLFTPKHPSTLPRSRWVSCN